MHASLVGTRGLPACPQGLAVPLVYHSLQLSEPPTQENLQVILPTSLFFSPFPFALSGQSLLVIPPKYIQNPSPLPVGLLTGLPASCSDPTQQTSWRWSPAPKREDRLCSAAGQPPPTQGPFLRRQLQRTGKMRCPSYPLLCKLYPLGLLVTTSQPRDTPEPLYLIRRHHLSYAHQALPSLPFLPHSSLTNKVYLSSLSSFPTPPE